jgi:hypothetical protein
VTRHQRPKVHRKASNARLPTGSPLRSAFLGT